MITEAVFAVLVAVLSSSVFLTVWWVIWPLIEPLTRLAREPGHHEAFPGAVTDPLAAAGVRVAGAGDRPPWDTAEIPRIVDWSMTPVSGLPVTALPAGMDLPVDAGTPSRGCGR